MKISVSEMEIMKLIWKQNAPVSANSLMSLLTNKEWKLTTLLTFLTRLCEKGFLQVQKNGRSNLYFPLISYEQYRQSETQQFVEQVHGGSVKSLFAALCSTENLTQKDLEELTKWFKER